MTGKFDHSIDAKGRLFVPSKLREQLGDHFHIAIGSNRERDGGYCAFLTLYPEQVWQQMLEKINASPSGQAAEADVLLAYADSCEPDAQGRILIRQDLREYAGLKKDVVITGSSNKAKIWDKAVWEKRAAPRLDAARVAEMFDLLGL